MSGQDFERLTLVDMLLFDVMTGILQTGKFFLETLCELFLDLIL